MIELAGPDEGRVGEELSVRYEVNGRQLVGIIVAWGDGVADSVMARGAQTASGSVHHTYTESGRFTVTGTAEDIVEGMVEDRVEIDILPIGGAGFLRGLPRGRHCEEAGREIPGAWPPCANRSERS